MKKTTLILSNLLFWGFTALISSSTFSIMWLIIASILHNGKGPEQIEEGPVLFIFLTIGTCIFYVSYFLFRFFVKRPIRFAWLALCYIILTLIISLPAEFVSRQALFILVPVLYFNICGFLFKAGTEWIKDTKIKTELEKDKLASQLELLQSKIDPHFLFNNLNNIDVFIQEDPKQASEYLKKLSDILRFMLYEANAERIPLATEIEYIRKYVDLQKIRTSNDHFVKLEMNGDPADKWIAPMILIHFIENAFKYAGNKKVENAVTIRLDIAEKQLSFFCKNHIYSTKNLGNEKNGLGVHLLKQKLDLLYKNEHVLLTKEENDWYIVNLEIRLDEN